MPSCGRAMCRIGCARIEEKALVSQPCVGMIDGVAARRAECTPRLSAASWKEEASRLARRIRRVQVHPDLVGPHHRGPGVGRALGERRAADAGGLHLGIDRLEVGEDPDAGVALGDAGEGVGESGQPAVQLAELLRQPCIFLRKTGRLREIDRARDGGVTHAAAPQPPQTPSPRYPPSGRRYETSTIFEGSESCGTRTTVQRRLAIRRHTSKKFGSTRRLREPICGRAANYGVIEVTQSG